MHPAPALLLAIGLGVVAAGVRAQAVAPAGAASAPPPNTLPAVRIEGQRDNLSEQRRQSTAAKIVIGREEIEQYGDSTLGDVIRRLPGVTQGGRPGRGGELRLRGMGGGYTQILIDGERAPPGFSIDQLSPDLVERIELLRAPTAETGARAIAGTINIVLREPLRKLGDELRAGVEVERGRASPQFGWTRNDSVGDSGSVNLTINANESRQRTDTRTRTTYTDAGAAVPALDQEDADTSIGLRRAISLSSRWQWRLGPGEQFSLQPFLLHNESRNDAVATLLAVGAAPPPAYAARVASNESGYDIARLNGQLMKRLGTDTRAELRGHVGRFDWDSRSRQDQFSADGRPVLAQRSATAIADRSWSLTGKLLHQLGGGHSLVGGWELETARRVDNTATFVDEVLQEGDFGTDVHARTRRQALYLQDEWDPAEHWSAYLGLRAETIRTRSDGATFAVDHRSRVVSPLAHLVWRFAAPRRDQLRLSLTHSYRAPSLQQLSALPSLNTLYPVPGSNVAASPDRAGNPTLQPELARGLDLALERYLEGGGIVSVNLFWRRIRALMRNVTALEDVAWADVPRWVSRPRNLGKATTQGLEFDAKLRLSEWREDWPPLSLRLNLSLYGSKVDSVPGPDNRIDQQPRATGNLGADYRFPGTAWTLGGTLAFTPGYRTQLTELQSQQIGLRRVIDAYLLWQIEPGTRLRLTLANLAPRDSVSAAGVLQDTQLQTVTSRGRTALNAELRLEMKL